MATKKLGAPTGMFDADSNEIHVGDILKDSEGKEFTVDKFGHIVSLPYKFCDTRKPRNDDFYLRKWDEEEVKLPPVEEAPAVKAEAADKMNEDIDSAVKCTIFEFPDNVLVAELKRRDYRLQEALSDNDLADELRRREYTVKAYKTVMVPTTVEL